MGELILLRHGQTEWSASGRHTGRTDVPLTATGEAGAAALAPMLEARTRDGRAIAAVFTSPAARARRTAQLAGLGCADGDGTAASAGTTGPPGPRPVPETDPDLWEWDYGGYEGMTTQQIREQRPGWYLWRDGVVPGDAAHPGETVDEVGLRADRVLARATRALPRGDVILVAHGHLLRILTARYLALPATDGKLFRLDTGTLSALGTEHREPVILAWNVPPGAA